MSRLLTFNPYNDLALASGLSRYTPPKAGTLLERSAWTLLRYGARPGDVLWDGITRLDGLRFDAVEPWGWSAAERWRLRQAGCPVELLPDDRYLEICRQLSHRRTAAAINIVLGNGLQAKEITDASEIDGGGLYYVVKAPWSSSGRGVLIDDRIDVEGLRRHAEGVIRRQGSAMLERRLEGVEDFAMLYRMEKGCPAFVGLSLFKSSRTGAYTGNVIAPQRMLADHLERVSGRLFVADLSQQVAQALADVIGDRYEGNLGVDMMLYREKGGGIAIAPSVEVNLRSTMGFVALGVAREMGATDALGATDAKSATSATGAPHMADAMGATGVMNILPDTLPVPSDAVHLVPPGHGFNAYFTPMPLD